MLCAVLYNISRPADALFAQGRKPPPAKLIISRTAPTLEHPCRPYYRSMAAKSEIVFRVDTYGTEADLYIGGRFNRRVDLRFLAESTTSHLWELNVGAALKVLDGPGSAFAALVRRGIEKGHVKGMCHLPFWCAAWLITLGPKVGLNVERAYNVQEYQSGRPILKPVCPELEQWRQETVTLLESYNTQEHIR